MFFFQKQRFFQKKNLFSQQHVMFKVHVFLIKISEKQLRLKKFFFEFTSLRDKSAATDFVEIVFCQEFNVRKQVFCNYKNQDVSS